MTIERAIEILDPEHRECYDSIETVNEACRMGIIALKKLITSSTEEVRHGEWVEPDDEWEACVISCICSVCGWRSHLFEDDVNGMPYCPNCGAKMDGEVDG